MKRMVIINKYGEEICELEHNPGTSFYKVKDSDKSMFDYLDAGDELKVVSVWTEED